MRWTALALFGVALALACNGNTPPATANLPPFESSLPATQPLAQLSELDLNTFCGELASFAQATWSPMFQMELRCRRAGQQAASNLDSSHRTSGDLRNACARDYDACKAEPPMREGPLPYQQNSCRYQVTVDATCTATVDQYAACVNEMLANVWTLHPSCAELTDSKLAEALAENSSGSSGPACTAFYDACPVTSRTTPPPPF